MKLIVRFFLLTPLTAYASAIDQLLHDPITIIFILVILSTLGFFMWRFDRFAVMHGPEILTTLGIFGCFLGIASALLGFDPDNVSRSVPGLLNGVKTAFWASVAGVFGALVVKLRQRFTKSPIPVSEGDQNASSLEDVVYVLTELKRSIAGSEDSSLIAQIKLMRQEQNDHGAAMRRSLDEFAEKVSELGSKALIEALERVIRDFNTQLNEQFGENFKQLNLAVEKLVIWQQQYKEELDKLQLSQQQSAADLRVAAASFTDLVRSAQAYTESAEKLKQLISVFEAQYALLLESQNALSKVLGDMKSAEPEFSKKLTDLTETFKSGTGAITAEIQKSIEKLSAETAILTNDFGKKTQAQMESFGELLKNTIPGIQKGINTQLEATNNELKKNFETLDKNLEAELQKALIGLGQQLASLSEKFVQDYTPLTERLREVVNMTRGV
jgi:DNA anti-recombination protein RmuC